MTISIPRTKGEILIRNEHGRAYPAINVKRHNAPAWTPERIDAEFQCGKSRAEKVAEICYEVAVEDFWRDSTAAAASTAYGEKHGLKIYGVGRSGGTLIVDGLPPVESWDGVALMRWRRFVQLIKSEIEYRESWEWARETIEANEWAPRADSPEGERQAILDNADAERRALTAFFAIHGELDGKEGDPDTLERIAGHVRAAGLSIREPQQEDLYVATS